METDANRYKKNKALDKIEREYKECRSQLKENKDWQERVIKCVSEKFNKEEALPY